MAHRYDTRTTIFSPEGRLYQVEYAMEAISHAGMCLGILTNEGIVLAAEKRVVAKLLDTSSQAEKIYKLDGHIACTVAGITADANVLVGWLRNAAQRHLLMYQEPIPVEQLVTQLCDVKQVYTQAGGHRPFGVSLLYGGYDAQFGFQLYQSDPSGNFGAWKATCIGSNQQGVKSILQSDYKEDMTLQEALMLAVKIFNKTLDSTALSADKLEFATMTLKDKRAHYQVMTPAKVQEVLAQGEAIRKAEEEAEKAKKDAAAARTRVEAAP